MLPLLQGLPALRALDGRDLAPDGGSLTRAQIAQALERPDESLTDLERHYGPRYADRLY